MTRGGARQGEDVRTEDAMRGGLQEGGMTRRRALLSDVLFPMRQD